MGETASVRRPVVVVVDDDPDVLRSLQFAFEVDGFQVRAFENAEALLEQAHSTDEGCLVLDYKLDGMDGLTLLELLREQGRGLPAVLITTANAGVSLRAARAGVVIVEKPLMGNGLGGEVRRLLGLTPRVGQPTSPPAAC